MTMPAIRAAIREDLPKLLDLLQQLDPQTIAAGDLASATWERSLASGHATVLVADIDGHLAATCMLVLVDNLTNAGRPWAVIENVVTDAAWRKRGLGRLVLDAALTRAWEAGCYKVMLATRSKREATLRFYEAAGFIRGEKTFFQIRR